MGTSSSFTPTSISNFNQSIPSTSEKIIHPGISKVSPTLPSSIEADKMEAFGGRFKKKKKRVESFHTYIYKLLREIHPDTGMSKKSIWIFISFVEDVFDRITEVASGMAHKGNKKTIGAQEIQLAAKLILPGELAKHASGEISRALKKFNESKR